MKEANKKKEEKIKELQEFISRFSANASKSKQATSRKRALEKIQLDDMRPSSRKYPYIDFRPNREIGNEVLMVEGLSKTVDGVKLLDHITFTLGHEDKVAFVGGNEQATTMLFKILMGEEEADEGTFKWGVTTSQAYFPKDNTAEFDNDLTITEWLTGRSERFEDPCTGYGIPDRYARRNGRDSGCHVLRRCVYLAPDGYHRWNREQ